MESMLVKSWRGMKPLLLKLGIALALSAAGYIAGHFRPRPHRPTSPSSPESRDEHVVAAAANSAGGCLGDKLRNLRNEEAPAQIISGTFGPAPATSTDMIEIEPPPSTKNSGEEEGFLLPEFNEFLLKEFDATSQEPETMPTTPMLLNGDEKKALEQEVSQLSDLVWNLQERERGLEFKLLEYYGLKEQETAVRELENRLNISKVDVQFLSTRVESLQAQNERLRAQVSEYSRTMTELEAATVKVKLLKKKLKADGEQAKEKIASLQQRISMLEQREVRDGGDAAGIERRVKDLEVEIMNLRRENFQLIKENSELVKKLESTQMLASSVLHGQEAEVLKEVNGLREMNDKLSKEIEQLQTDRCADVEELVYLRWINACLRYELRDYQPPNGKTVARDLSKSLSPKSEEKAKQLILEYANSGINDKSISLLDFDSDCSSSSLQASNDEVDDISFDAFSTTKKSSSSKSKFFSKLMKLVLGKGRYHNRASSLDRTPTSCGHSERRASVSTCSSDDIIGRHSYDSPSSCITDERYKRVAQSQSSFRPSSDAPILMKINQEELKEGKGERSKSDVGISFGYKRLISGDDNLSVSINSLIDHEDVDAPESANLKKFAKALESSRKKSKLKKRAASFSFS